MPITCGNSPPRASLPPPDSPTVFVRTCGLLLLIATSFSARAQLGDDFDFSDATLEALPGEGLPWALSRGDYRRSQPLETALRYGFGAIELDVHLHQSKLHLAEAFWELTGSRTLTTQYLAPLQERVLENGGWVYETSSHSLWLFLDLRSYAVDTYARLNRQLQRREGMFTRFHNSGEVDTGAVTVILTGGPPKAVLREEPTRLAAMEGHLHDSSLINTPTALMPVVGGRWSSHFSWDGSGEMPPAEQARLKNLLRIHHAYGRRVRLWDIPDKPAVWRSLRTLGVDFIETAQPAAFQQAMEAMPPP